MILTIQVLVLLLAIVAAVAVLASCFLPCCDPDKAPGELTAN
jgi:hypothetical protein